MPDPERPQAALPFVQRYHRRERMLNALVALLIGALLFGTFLWSSLLLAALLGLVLTVLVRVPLFQSRGTTRLRTDESPEAVVEAFTGSTPPVLAFQWGLANAITATDTEATYEISWLFGLRTIELRIDSQRETTADGTDRIELSVTVAGEPWASYTVTVEDATEGTLVEVAHTSDRRFDLRTLPQKLLVERYYGDALAAQGYTILERDTHFGR